MAAEDRAGPGRHPDPRALVAALADAKAALEAAEADATGELIAAKLAYRDDPSEGNRWRKAEAVEVIREIRAAVRADRPGIQVGGDAYTDDETTGGVQR